MLNLADILLGILDFLLAVFYLRVCFRFCIIVLCLCIVQFLLF